METARIAQETDIDDIVVLAREAISELSVLRGGEIWSKQAGRREPLDVGLRAQLGRCEGQGAVVVGTIDGAVIGYGVTQVEHLVDGSVLSTITDLYVHPKARGVGVGEAIMDVLIADARACGAIGIDSLALPGDRETKNFFETFGLKARAIVVHRTLGGDGGS